MRALKYAGEEALASLWRSRDAALLAVVTIATALGALGALLLVTSNAEAMLARWESAAELSIFLEDGIGEGERAALELRLVKSEVVAAVEYLSKAQALERFRQDFAELAPVAGTLGHNPFPASFEIRLEPAARGAPAVDALAVELAGTAGVADVRYDRAWLQRLTRALNLLRGLGLLVVVVLTVGAALTVVSVIRLACHARREEIEIMQLVGAPAAYVRGPFVAEGVLEGGAGALLALAALWIGFTYLRAEYGPAAAQLLGASELHFLPWTLCGALVGGGMAVGCVGGLVGALGATAQKDG